MKVQILMNFTDQGKNHYKGNILDETTMDIQSMLDWIDQKRAVEISDYDEPRGTQKRELRNSIDFIQFCFDAANEDWGYVWGGRGEKYTSAERDYLYKMYNTTKYNRDYFYVTQWNRWKDHHVCDCSGLIESFSGINKTAEGFYAMSTVKGPIGTFDRTPGYLVFRYSSTNKRMVHVGVFTGNDIVVESKDSDTGVVKSDYFRRNWTHWAKPTFIEFIEGTTDPGPNFTLSRVIKLTTPNLMKGSDIAGMQKVLISYGYPVGSSGADGVYGQNSYNAVRMFQENNYLKADGIVGKETTIALKGTWKGV